MKFRHKSSEKKVKLNKGNMPLHVKYTDTFLCQFTMLISYLTYGVQSAQSKKRFFLFSPRTYGVFSRRNER